MRSRMTKGDNMTTGMIDFARTRTVLRIVGIGGCSVGVLLFGRLALVTDPLTYKLTYGGVALGLASCGLALLFSNRRKINRAFTLIGFAVALVLIVVVLIPILVDLVR